MIIELFSIKHEPELYLGPRLYEGIPVGSVVGVSGDGNRDWILEFIKMNHDCDAAWLEDVMDVLPTALKVRNVDLSRITFLESGENWNQAFSHVLRSNHFDIVVIPQSWVSDLKDRKAWSRFIAWVKGSGITVFLLSDYPEPMATTPIRIHTGFKEQRMFASKLR